MKTKSGLLIGILTLGTILGLFALTVGITRASTIITVYPSGGDDTTNIQAAFDVAGPGDTVQLAAGQFYTNEIYVVDFDGTFKGAGKDLTKIDVLRGLDPTLPGVYGPMATHLFSFEGGNVHISDLSFEITPYEPAEPWGPPPPDGWWYDLLSVILITGDINSLIENIKFTGHEGTALYDPWHPLYSVKSYNTRVGVEYGGGLTTTGSHVISNCDFNSLWLGVTAWGLMNCELTITSNSIKGGAIGIINAENVNSKFEISYNDIETNAYAGIWAMQFAPSPCQWLITRNTVRPSLFADGIALADYTGSGSLEAVVSYNNIVCDTFWGGIWTYGLQDAYIGKNLIHGTGDYGIGCAFTDNSMIHSNTISNYGNNGIFFMQANQNVIRGNLLLNNGGWGLFMAGSNDNYITSNLFYNNDLGNIFDDGINHYGWNWLF